MGHADFPFDVVLFDLDGTLLATDRFWIPAARVGARRAFEELGIQREIPSAEEWMSMVGLPLSEGFDQVFPDLPSEQRALIQARCVEEEHFALESGSAALLPGVRDVLEELAGRGVPMGIASNCSQSYLDSAMSKVELRKYISEGRCLESRGIHNKAEMIEDLLLTFGTRSAVMVGDRAGDRNAAHANGLPHVHLENGFAPRGESVVCEAQISDFLELIPRLEGRTRWIDGLLEQLGIGAEAQGPKSLGISGHSGSGKTLLARDVTRRLESLGRSVKRVALSDYARIGKSSLVPAGGVPALELPGHGFRIDDLVSEVLEPHMAGTGDELLLVEGPYLLHPCLRSLLDRVVFLDVPEDLLLRRVAARELPLGRATAFERMRAESLPAEVRFDEACPPVSRADLVLNAQNPLGPGDSEAKKD
jgi:phosphoglycolate phosphatase